MHSYYRDLLLFAIENGTVRLKDSLIESLPEFSRQGSGDDVTICGIIDVDKASDYKLMFERDNEIVRKESILIEIEDRLKSMNGMGKMDALKCKYENALFKASEAQKAFAEAEEEYDLFTSDLLQLGQNDNARAGRVGMWNKEIDLVYPDNQDEKVKTKGDELHMKVEQARQYLQMVNEELKSIEEEYKAYTARKIAYESQHKEIEQELAELRNFSL
jgi:chromosome segregation ATPase